MVGINTYYNNDYSEEACIGTGITRQLKAEKEAGYVGDFFFTDECVQEYAGEDANRDMAGNVTEGGDVDE